MSIQDIVNNSGYPLQMCLHEKITETQGQHHWKVLVPEHRWVNQENHEEGYIDLVLGHDRYSIRLVIECKRVRGSWNFLVSSDKNDSSSTLGKVLKASSNPKFLCWEEGCVSPGSHASMFCVPEVSGQNDKRTLENIAGGYYCLQRHWLKKNCDYGRKVLTKISSNETESLNTFRLL